MRAVHLPLHWLVPAALAIGAGFLPAAQHLDLRAMDLFRTAHAPHPDIVIVAIDNKSLQEIGRWPWSRSTHADFFNVVSALKPRAVGVDVMWAEPENAQADGRLAEALAAAAFPIVLPTEEIRRSGEEWPSALLPLEQLRKAKNVSLGHVSIPAESDGVSRLFPGTLITKDGTYPSFGAELAMRLGGEKPEDGDALIDFAGPAGSFPTLSFADVLKGRVDASQIQDKILLIGATASDLHDTAITPEGVMAGVEWQANVLDNAVLHPPLAMLSRWLAVLIAAVMGLGVFGLLHILSHRIGLAVTAIALIVPPLVGFIAWNMGTALPYLYADALVLLAFGGQALERWFHAEKERRTLRISLQSYLSPLVLEATLKDPTLLRQGGYRREITAYFTDLRGFTTLSEAMEPAVLEKLLYEYFDAMTHEVFSSDGVVCRYTGDGMFALWGAPIDQPDHTVRAVRTGIRMLKKLDELQENWSKRGIPRIDMGVGINTGMATVGNLGSSKRFDFSPLGDCVNSAARLESLNKEHKTNILISAEVKRKLPDDIKTRSLGEIFVKGKKIPMIVHEVTPDNWRPDWKPEPPQAQ